jgi:curved DNA-binding protein CbpA
MRLGVPPGATHDTIKQIYRDLCNVWHPDRFEHNERLKDKATKELQEMQQAYEHISSHFAEAGYSSGN